MVNFIFKCERWRFNKEFGVWVSTEGHFKDRNKRVIPPTTLRGGYLVVKTEIRPVLAHRLVLMTWRPCPDYENLTVDHLNHNKRDNSIKNLEWVTEEINQERAKKDCLTVEDFKEFRTLTNKYNTLVDQMESIRKKVDNQAKEIKHLRELLQKMKGVR